MPELPEIETVKLQLQAVLVGKRLSEVKVLNERTVQGDEKILIGKKVTGIRRKGKVLILDMENDVSVAFHFKMTGQLILEQDLPAGKAGSVRAGEHERIVGGHPTKDFIGKLPSSHTRVVMSFVDSRLYFNDQRMFGWMKIGKTEEIDKLKLLENMGPEIWNISVDDFAGKLKRTKRPIKLAIMDQEVISGVGNIYANDALWEAKVDPGRSADTLTDEEYKDLYFGIRKVLEDGIKYGGATASDAKYIDLHGMGGRYTEYARTYDRTGEKCNRDDGGLIKKITLGGRGTYFCTVCQK